MLAVLFLGVRMRVTWLTQGTGNPPVWMQAWMYCTTYAVLAMTLCVVVIPLFTGEIIGVDQKTGDIKEDVKPFDNFILAGCFTVLKYLIMIACMSELSASSMVHALTFHPKAFGQVRRFLLCLLLWDAQ
jgi:hypothetical protein